MVRPMCCITHCWHQFDTSRRLCAKTDVPCEHYSSYSYLEIGEQISVELDVMAVRKEIIIKLGQRGLLSGILSLLLGYGFLDSHRCPSESHVPAANRYNTATA